MCFVGKKNTLEFYPVDSYTQGLPCSLLLFVYLPTCHTIETPGLILRVIIIIIHSPIDDKQHLYKFIKKKNMLICYVLCNAINDFMFVHGH